MGIIRPIFASFHTTQYDLNGFRVITHPFLYRGFHTTQYDLNVLCMTYMTQAIYSFHTTQYDLNFRFIFCFCYASMFPYYIVRFKLVFFIAPVIAPIKFPYYIVRFKLCSSSGSGNAHNPFPYYIVRFKHCRCGMKKHYQSGFHTTQYDLNRLRLDISCRKTKVSILHSTI